jgi:hypothetical protein
MGYFRITNETGKREKWLINAKAADLLKCCEERMKYHMERVKFWETQQVIAEKALKETGIKLTSHPVTGGNRTDVQLDPTMSNRVSECQNRLKENRQSVDRFRAYRAFFYQAGKETPDKTFDLNADDVLYFNLAGADAGEENTEGDN